VDFSGGRQVERAHRIAIARASGAAENATAKASMTR